MNCSRRRGFFTLPYNSESILYSLFLCIGLCVRVSLHGSCPSNVDLQGTSDAPQALSKVVKALPSRLSAP